MQGRGTGWAAGAGRKGTGNIGGRMRDGPGYIVERTRDRARTHCGKAEGIGQVTLGRD